MRHERRKISTVAHITSLADSTQLNSVAGGVITELIIN